MRDRRFLYSKVNPTTLVYNSYNQQNGGKNCGQKKILLFILVLQCSYSSLFKDNLGFMLSSKGIQG